MSKHTNNARNTTSNAPAASTSAPAATPTTPPAVVAAVAVAPVTVLGKCAAVHAWFAAQYAGGANPLPTVAQARAWGAANGYNTNNVQIEYYVARKRAGIRGRVAAPAPVAAPQQ